VGTAVDPGAAVATGIVVGTAVDPGAAVAAGDVVAEGAEVAVAEESQATTRKSVTVIKPRNNDLRFTIICIPTESRPHFN
jgi:hypothetical protein